MKVSLNLPYYPKNYNIQRNETSPYACRKMYAQPGADTVCFKGISGNKIAGTNIQKICSEAEFDKILNALKKDSSWQPQWNIEGITKFEQGLMPYAGIRDLSQVINYYLREGKILRDVMPKETLEDYIKITDYSLDELDKNMGKYEGVVYRYGITDTQTKCYTSTARDPHGAAAHANKYRPYNYPYYIIYTKNGHKIENLQKKLNYDNGFITETEILINPGTKFEEITDLTPEMIKLRNKLFNAMEDEHGEIYTPVIRLHFLREI